MTEKRSWAGIWKKTLMGVVALLLCAAQGFAVAGVWRRNAGPGRRGAGAGARGAGVRR